MYKFLVLFSALLFTTGCTTDGNDDHSTEMQPHWVLLFRGGGIGGMIDYNAEYDGIDFASDKISYYANGVLIKTSPVSHADGVSISTGLITSLTIIDGLTYVATETDDSLVLSENATDGFSYHYVRPSTFLEATGTVQYTDLEGGHWFLLDDSGETYDPMNLPDGFKVEGKAIQFSGVTCGSVLTYFGPIITRIYSITEVVSN